MVVELFFSNINKTHTNQDIFGGHIPQGRKYGNNSLEIFFERGRICLGKNVWAEFTFGEEVGAAARSADSEDFLFPGPSEAAFKKAKIRIRKVLAIITTYMSCMTFIINTAR